MSGVHTVHVRCQKLLPKVVRLGCCTGSLFIIQQLEQVKGIEPSHLAWKANVLPLNYTCMIFLWAHQITESTADLILIYHSWGFCSLWDFIKTNFKNKWYPRSDSNRHGHWPADFKSAMSTISSLGRLVRCTRIELVTHWLKASCSTAELTALIKKWLG